MAKNVHNLILDSISKKHLVAHGREASVFELAHADLKDDYVLRIDKHSAGTKGPITYKPSNDFKSALESSTSLTPPQYIASHVRIGQPLIHFREGNVTFSIRARQPGQPYRSMCKELEKEFGGPNAKTLATNEMLSKVNALSDESIARTLESICMVLGSKASNDFSPRADNLLYDPEDGLSIIDLYNFFENTRPPTQTENGTELIELHLESAINILGFYLQLPDLQNLTSSATTQEEHALLNTLETFHSKVRNAADIVQSRQGDSPLNHPLFRNVTGIQAIALTDPPHALTEKLREIERFAEIQR